MSIILQTECGWKPFSVQWSTMRVERNNPRRVYYNFLDWLRTGLNFIWALALVLGYLYYLLTTEEV